MIIVDQNHETPNYPGLKILAGAEERERRIEVGKAAWFIAD